MRLHVCQLVGLAFEVHDTWKNKSELARNPASLEVALRNSYQNVNPTVTDMLTYSFCYIGLLTGKIILDAVYIL